MRSLLDTHVWLWSLTAPEKLGIAVRALLSDPSHTLYLSAASAWEIAIKYGLGRLPLPEPPEKFVPQRLVRDGVRALPVDLKHALHVATLPDHHRDPFDRLLVAQSQIEDLPLLTADEQLSAYDVRSMKAV